MLLLPEDQRPTYDDPRYRKYLGKPHLKGKVSLDVDLLEVIDDEHILVLVDDRQLTVCSDTYTSLIPFEEGDRVFHIVFGLTGTVDEVDGLKMNVTWDNGGKAVVALTDVERA